MDSNQHFFSHLSLFCQLIRIDVLNIGWAKRFLRSPTSDVIVELRKKHLAQPTNRCELQRISLSQKAVDSHFR